MRHRDLVRTALTRAVTDRSQGPHEWLAFAAVAGVIGALELLSAAWRAVTAR